MLSSGTSVEKISEMSPDKRKKKRRRRRRRTEKALSQYTNFSQAIVCLHDWAELQNTTLYASTKTWTNSVFEYSHYFFFMCNDQS